MVKMKLHTQGKSETEFGTGCQAKQREKESVQKSVEEAMGKAKVENIVRSFVRATPRERFGFWMRWRAFDGVKIK